MKNNQLRKNIICTMIALLMTLLLINDTKAQEAKKEAPKEENTTPVQDIQGWRIRDYKPYVQAMKEISKLSKEYSEIILKLAIDTYSTGIDILEDMESEVIKIQEKNKNKKNLNEKWYWQEIDRKNQEERQIRMVKYEAKMKAITYFVLAINHLDDVQSRPVLESPEFSNFRKRLFQVFVSTQYDLHNFLSCIPILERYILLDNDTRKDIWAYKYLTNCYAFMETLLQKSKNASQEKIIQYRQAKNKYLLQSAEIQYGVDSVEYKHMQEIVSRDEKKSERLNDFR